MTLQQLKYFLEIAKTKNFSTAAKNLFVAQSSVSYAIHELEQELKVPLFVRDVNRKVTLTEYGEKYLPYAERIFNLLDEGENELKSMSDPLSGTVRMGFFYCVANSEIPKIFRQFYEDNQKSIPGLRREPRPGQYGRAAPAGKIRPHNFGRRRD